MSSKSKAKKKISEVENKQDIQNIPQFDFKKYEKKYLAL